VNNSIIIGIEDKLKRWQEYVKELFRDNRTDPRVEIETAVLDEGPEITRSEVIAAIKSQKNNKAPGPDQIHAEMLKLLVEKDAEGLKTLTKLLNSVYRVGKIPLDWLRSTFITIPKKSKAQNCDKYRIISLMSHVLKIFLRIIQSRMYRKCESRMSDTQFGFRNGLGTREALFATNVLIQRCRDMNTDIYACFIDYQKAFDTVRHSKMIEILISAGIDKRDIRIITELYWGQNAEIKVDNAMSEKVEIQRGVRQGCVLSPMLFNLYAETVFSEALNEETGGIKVNGLAINNIRYADDTLIMACTQMELQQIMNAIVQHSETMGLKLNTSKTKMMVFSKKPVKSELRINNVIIEQVSSLKYLGTILKENYDYKHEIRCRIEQARHAFLNMKNLLAGQQLNLELRMRIVRCYIFPVLMYGCESWTLNETEEKRIEALEMYIYRRMLWIAWTQKMKNSEVLHKMEKEVELLHSIKKRKIEYLGHVLRGKKYKILQTIIEGKIDGRILIGRRQNLWLKDLRWWIGCSSMELFRKAVFKVQIANWIANL
jgi:hypothetical protein